MAQVKFNSASEMSKFVKACQNAFIEGTHTVQTFGSTVALTQSWNSPSDCIKVLKDNTLEIPWTIDTWGEVRNEIVSTVSFEITFQSSQGTGKGKITIETGATAPYISIEKFEPSEKFLRHFADIEEMTTYWSYTQKAFEVLGWQRPATPEEIQNDKNLINCGGCQYVRKDVKSEAFKMLKKLTKPEPSEFMKMRGLVYA